MRNGRQNSKLQVRTLRSGINALHIRSKLYLEENLLIMKKGNNFSVEEMPLPARVVVEGQWKVLFPKVHFPLKRRKGISLIEHIPLNRKKVREFVPLHFPYFYLKHLQ